MVLSGIILLTSALCIYISTGAMNGFIVSKALDQANKLLNAKVTAGMTEGNPFTHLTLHNFSMAQGGREVLTIKDAEINLNLIRLLNKELVINKISVSNLNAHVWQNPDSTWNVQKLYVPTYTLPKSKPGTSSSFVFKIKKIECLKYSLSINSLDSLSYLPGKIEGEIALALLIQHGDMEVKMSKMTLQTTSPELNITNLAFDLKSDSVSYNWHNFLVNIPGTEIHSEGRYVPRQPEMSSAMLKIDTLDLENLHRFIPVIDLHGRPSLDLSAKGGKDKIQFSAELSEHSQNGHVDGWVKNLNADPSFSFKLDISNIDGAFWTGNPQYSSKLTGTLSASGKGFDYKTDSVQVTGNFPEITYQDKKLNNLSFSAFKEAENLNGNLETETWFGGILADIKIEDFLSSFHYSLHASTKAIDISKLGSPVKIPSSLNLNIDAKGEGWSPDLAKIDMTVHSSGSTIENKSIEEVSTSLHYQQGSYNVKYLRLNTPYFLLIGEGNGRLNGDHKIQFSFETKEFEGLMKVIGYQQYSLDGKIEGQFSGNTKHYLATADLDIPKFSVDKLTFKDLNGHFDMSKSKIFESTARLNASKVEMDSLTVKNLKADLNISLDDQLSMKLQVNSDSLRYSKEYIGAFAGLATLHSADSLTFETNLKLDSLAYYSLKTGAIELALKARIPLKQNKYDAIGSLHQLSDRFNPAPLQNYLKASLNDRITFNGSSNLLNLNSDSLNIKKLEASLSGFYNRNHFQGNLSAKTFQSTFYGIKMKESNLETAFSDKFFDNRFSFEFSDSVKGKINATVLVDSGIKIGLKHLEAQSPDHSWRSGSDSTTFDYRDGKLRINKFLLTTDQQKYFSVNGLYSMKGDENLRIRIQNMDLKQFYALTGGNVPLSGTGDATIDLLGTSGQPILDMKLTLNKLEIKERKIDQILGTLHYSHDTISIKGQMDVADQRMFEGDFKASYHLSLEETPGKPLPNAWLSSHLKLNQFDLSMLRPFIPYENIDYVGFLDSELKAEGTLDNFNVNGPLSLKDGILKIPDYGVNYERMHMKLDFQHDTIYIRDFKADAGAGSLQVTGTSSQQLQNGYQPKNLSLKIIGKQFKIVDSDRMQATINTNIDVKKENDNAVFSGNMDVIRSEANFDAFMEEYNKTKDSADPPMLIKAMEENNVLVSGFIKKDSVMVKQDANLLLYKNLKGSFNINVPGNMWVRGKDIGIEVKGDLQATKEGPHLVLFGNLEVKRGFYRMYGKRFDFKSGKITLTGEDEINPVLDFEVAYVFRDLEQKSRSLNLKISGRLKEPILAFDIDGKTLEEQDAISYLIFGSSVNELTQSQQSSMNYNVTGAATNLALNQMSSLFKDLIQSSLKLDVVEIAGDNNWSMGTVNVGKYLSKNLYVSYQYNFALDKQSKIIDPMKISMEYQFLSFMSLVATNQDPNSGFDLIFTRDFK